MFPLFGSSDRFETRIELQRKMVKNECNRIFHTGHRIYYCPDSAASRHLLQLIHCRIVSAPPET